MKTIPPTLLAIAVFCGLSSAQTTWYVPDDFATIQAGIDGSAHGDIVIVRDGIYLEIIDFNGKNIWLKSENGPSLTTLDANGMGTGVTFQSGETNAAIFEGFTIINGGLLAGGDGGGIACLNQSNPIIRDTWIGTAAAGNSSQNNGGGMYCESSSPTLEDCIFTGNWAENGNGGGLHCQSSSPTLTNCTFIDNWANFGGGAISCWNSSSPTLNQCTFNYNSVRFGSGGGLSCLYSSAPTLADCTFTGNSADSGGGVYCLSASAPTFDDCTFTGNQADAGLYGNGGGMHIDGSSPSLTNCTFSGNLANDYGGGIYCDASSPVISDSLIVNNVAYDGRGSGDGGGLACANSSAPQLINVTLAKNSARTSGGGLISESASSPALFDCILWGNIATADPGISASTASVSVSYSCIQDGTGQSWFGADSIDTDPLFVDPANDDFHLQATSPAIDAGDPNSPPDPDGTRADMGAFYFDQGGQSPTLTISNLIAGQTATADFSYCTPNNTVIFAWSLAGGGPINTPYGTGFVSPPFTQINLNTNANSTATMSATVPAALSNTPIWFHGVDLGSGIMLNNLALTIQ
jgi:predicted outer membrane repeat protein